MIDAIAVIERRFKRAARQAANVRHNAPVVYLENNQPPRAAGHGFYWETRNGTPIRHPIAYGYKGRSNMRYVHSTFRVEVGVAWDCSSVMST